MKTALEKTVNDYLEEQGINLPDEKITEISEKAKEAYSTTGIWEYLNSVSKEYSSAKVKKKLAPQTIQALDQETGEVVATYSSLYEAAKKLNKPKGWGNIGNCIKGKSKICYGYKWRAASENI